VTPHHRSKTADPIPRSTKIALATAVAVAVAVAAVAIAASSGGETEPVVTAPPAERGFGVGNWPPADWRPYADDSPFNQRIPDDPRIDERSKQIVNRLTESGGPSDLRAGLADSEADYQHPTYWSQARDPVFTVDCERDVPEPCEIEGMRVRVPDRARPAAGSDGHLTVVAQQSGWEYDFYGVESKPEGGGVIEMSYGGRTRIDGDGLGSDATAAWFGNLAGIIRAQELQAGRIEHALFIIADCDNGEFVYPAMGLGAACPDTADAPAEGQRFQLDMSEGEIAALGAPRWKRAILRAMAEYGMYVGDTGGSPWDLEFESGSTYTSFGYPDPLVAYARRAGLQPQDGRYLFDVASGIDWSAELRVIDPCVTERTC